MRTKVSRRAQAALAAAFACIILGACGNEGGSEIQPVSTNVDEGGVAPIGDSALATPDPEKEKALQLAKEAKEEEAKNPNKLTVCLNPDGTQAGIIKHDPRPDSPDRTKVRKDAACKASFGEKTGNE